MTDEINDEQEPRFTTSVGRHIDATDPRGIQQMTEGRSTDEIRSMTDRLREMVGNAVGIPARLMGRRAAAGEETTGPTLEEVGNEVVQEAERRRTAEQQHEDNFRRYAEERMRGMTMTERMNMQGAQHRMMSMRNEIERDVIQGFMNEPNSALTRSRMRQEINWRMHQEMERQRPVGMPPDEYRRQFEGVWNPDPQDRSMHSGAGREAALERLRTTDFMVNTGTTIPGQALQTNGTGGLTWVSDPATITEVRHHAQVGQTWRDPSTNEVYVHTQDGVQRMFSEGVETSNMVFQSARQSGKTAAMRAMMESNDDQMKIAYEAYEAYLKGDHPTYPMSQMDKLKNPDSMFMGVKIQDLKDWKIRQLYMKETGMTVKDEQRQICARRQEVHNELMGKLSTIVDKYPLKTITRCVPPDAKVIHRLSGNDPLAYMTKYERTSPLDYKTLDTYAASVVESTRRLVFFDKYNFSFVKVPIKLAPVKKGDIFVRILGVPEVVMDGYVLATIGRRQVALRVTKKDLVRKRIYLSREVPFKLIFDHCPEILEYYNNGKKARHDLGHSGAVDESGSIEVFGDLSDIDSDILVQNQIAALSQT